jgi:hypothetical protein
MRYLLLISGLVFLSGCTTLYSNLQKTNTDIYCLQQFRPSFTAALYNATVNVTDKHLSGLLLIKKMPDSSTRLVFSNEMGFTFFDFEFTKDGHFSVHQVLAQLNKKPVLRTLQKDFELILMQHLDDAKHYALKDDSLVYITLPQSKGFYYYITDTGCTRLIKLERASKRKVVMEAIMQNYTNGLPDTIGISHKNFNFDIGLKKIIR